MVGNKGPIVEGYHYLASCTTFTSIMAKHITTAPHCRNCLAYKIIYSEIQYLINLGTKLTRSKHQVFIGQAVHWTRGGGGSQHMRAFFGPAIVLQGVVQDHLNPERRLFLICSFQ